MYDNVLEHVKMCQEVRGKKNVLFLTIVLQHVWTV